MHGVCREEKLQFLQDCLKNYKNSNALSIVMGHEIAHAVAEAFFRKMVAMLITWERIADIFLGGAINRTRNTDESKYWFRYFSTWNYGSF